MSVIKLLYQSDPRNKGTVIALRPDTDDPLPCVLTLDQSPLEEAKYEIITHGEYTLSFTWSQTLLISTSSLLQTSIQTSLRITYSLVEITQRLMCILHLSYRDYRPLLNIKAFLSALEAKNINNLRAW